MTRDEVLRNLTELADQYTSALEAIEGSESKLIDVYGARVKAFRAAAEIIRESGWRPIAEALDGPVICGKYSSYGTQWLVYRFFTARHAAKEGYTHYLPEPAPPAREVENG